MQFAADPLLDPGAWDVLIAAGKQHPGLFRLEGDAPRNYKWDVKDAPAMQGAFMTYRGWRPTLDIKGSFVFWDPGQIREFYDLYAPIWQLDARKFGVKPVAVYHPTLAANDINLLVPVTIGGLVGNSKDGWSIKYTWHEYRAAKIIIPKTPDGANFDKKSPVPQSEQQKEIMRLRAENPGIF
jgi:hypothetical protein